MKQLEISQSIEISSVTEEATIRISYKGSIFAAKRVMSVWRESTRLIVCIPDIRKQE